MHMFFFCFFFLLQIAVCTLDRYWTVDTYVSIYVSTSVRKEFNIYIVSFSIVVVVDDDDDATLEQMRIYSFILMQIAFWLLAYVMDYVKSFCFFILSRYSGPLFIHNCMLYNLHTIYTIICIVVFVCVVAQLKFSTWFTRRKNFICFVHVFFFSPFCSCLWLCLYLTQQLSIIRQRTKFEWLRKSTRKKKKTLFDIGMHTRT